MNIKLISHHYNGRTELLDPIFRIDQFLDDLREQGEPTGVYENE
jgi:hypothetical protein